MKYFKLKFLLIFAALAMAIPPAWAETVELDFTTNTWGFPYSSTNSTNGEHSYTNGIYTIILYAPYGSGQSGAYYSMLANGEYRLLLGKTNAKLTLPAFTKKVTKIDVVGYSSASGKVTQNIFVDLTAVSSETTGATSTNTYLIDESYQDIGTIYSLKVTNNNNTQISKIIVYLEDSDEPPVTNDPSLSVNKNELILKEPNGSFTVTGENLVDDIGLSRSTDIFNHTLAATEGTTDSGVYNGNPWWAFRKSGDNKVNGTVTVNYPGRDLTATGSFTVATKKEVGGEDISKTVTVTYQPDLYIYCDLIDGQSWRYYPDEPQMTYDDGVYTKTVTITNPGSCILFARAADLSYSWNDDRMFFGAKYDSDWVYGVDTSTGLGIYGSGNNNQYYPIKFNQAGVYTITINAANNTFSVTSTNVKNIAEAQAFDGTFTFTGDVVVTYQNGDNLWIRDIANRDGEIKSGLIVGSVDDFTNGDILKSGWKANNRVQYFVPQFINPTGVELDHHGDEAAPEVLTKITTDDVNKYATISNVTVTAISGKKYTVTINGDGPYYLYDQFGIVTTNNPIVNGNTYNVVGVISIYSGDPELYLTEFEEFKELKVTLTSDTKTAEIGETIPVTVTVENAEGDYSVTYKFGENGTENTLTGNTINVTSETAGDVTLYVTVTNNGNVATASETYTFTEPLSGNNVFTKVKSADQLVAGKRYIIVYDDKAMGTSVITSSSNGQWLAAVDVTAVSGDDVQVGDGVAIMTLGGSLGSYTLALGDNYLHAVNNTTLGFTGEATNWAISDYNGTLNGYRVKHADNSRAVRYSTSSKDRFGNYALSDNNSDYGWIYVEKASTPQPELAVSLPEAPAENYKVGQVVKVKATVENGSENTVLTYKVGEETLTPDAEGNVTLPNKKSGEVVLTVTAVDGEKTATDTKTYVFDKADALTITLTPATGTYYVGDEQNVTVTVEDAIDANPTITYKFGEEGTVQNYNAETGILLPTSEAGTINLIVMVDDNGYEHAGETTATGSYTINYKALTVTLTPESGTYTVGQEAKVKVTVENAVGELVVEYKIGNKDYEPDTQGYITLPNDKAGEVTLTVTALDSRPDAQAVEKSGTYIFTAAPAITFTMNTTETNYTVGDEIKVKVAEVENAIGDYAVTYKIGDTTLTPDEDGYVTIPSDEAGEVELTVTVEDLYDHAAEATQTITFNIAAAPAIGITLTATPEAETYTVGDKVNVKVTTTNTIGNDVEITYSTNFTREGEQTYNPEKGIDITSNEAGTVTLTVNVFDGYEHEGADESDITSKTATYTFNAAPAIEITLTPNGGTYDINDNVNVKVDVDKTIGNDYLVVYQINDGEEQNYTEAGITIPSDKAETVTLKVTVEDGYEHEGEAIVTAEYKFNPAVPIAAPTFSPAAGTYTEPKEVAIACATPGVTIMYSINGGTPQAYTKPFMVSESCTVTATATMGTRTSWTPATNSAQYTINALPAATITDGYYNLINNALSGKYANVAGRRTLNFVDDPADKAGTVFRIETNNNGQVQTLRSQACDIQDYAKRAMNYVPTLVQVVINKLNNMDGVDDATGPGNILGENGLKALMDKFNECFDYNLYVEGGENAYRIYARTPSMQNVVDFYAEHKAQVDEKLPMLEDYINQVLAKIRSKVPAGMNANVFEPFSLLTVWEEMGGQLIKPVKGENDDITAIMAFYEQVLTNKEYVWDFAYTTAKHYLNNIKGTQTYEGLVAQHPDIDIYVGKMEEIRPETKFFIIQNGNEPDYVAETHSYIKQNLPMTYWTLTEREKFTVNVPEANKLNDSYYTTLYTDFGYTLPEGVEAYAVTGIDANDVAQLTKITDVIPAQTPVLLKATAAGDKELTLKKESRGGAVEGNLLEGPDYLVKTYGIASPTVEMLFSMAEPFVPAETLAEYEYLKLRTSGTVNNKYFWSVNDALDSCTYKNANNEDDCVVRSLAVKNGTLAFSEHWTTENNKAFLVSDTKPVIYLEKETLAAPTFSPVPGSYTVDNGENVTITITAEDGATISYSTDGGKTWNTYEAPITASDDMTIVAKAVKDGMIASDEVTAVYVIDNPTVLPDVPAMKGYYQIKNNGNNKYANVAGRKTLNFKSEDEAKTEAGTVIWLETNGKGQVQSIRSQAADLQRYADRAMTYVPDIVNIVVNKINEMNGIEDATGAGSVLGENGLGLIMEEFNKSFDHHLYVEQAEGGYRLYGKTPSMQPVVDFYRAHTAQVEAKLLKLEDFINDALTILKNKIGNSNVFSEFKLHDIWQKMGGTLTEPTDDASTMAFYREVLNNKNYVWDFAYQTAMTYLNYIKDTQTYKDLVNEHPEILQYIDKIEQVHPDFKYYVVQQNDKPDFISEGNTDIINNVDRTIWTLVPRTTFDVKIDNNQFGCPLAGGVGGYATTLYTDFAYTVPEGVTAYKVTSIEGGKATIEALSGIIPAQTPVLLTAKVAGTATLTLKTEAGTADMSGNLLYGPDYLINKYDLKTEQVQSLFEQIKAKIGQDFYDTYVKQYEYLADLNSGTVNNKYFWGLTQSDVEKCVDEETGEDCVVRNLSGDKFIDNWKVETNKAFLVTDEYAEITLNTLRGDVNHDGYVSIKDVTDLIDRLLNIEGPACPYCSDVNENHVVNIKDVTDLIDILLGNDTNTTEPEEGGGE